MNVVERVKTILVTPKTEWQAIETEPGDPVYLFTNYVAMPIFPAVRAPRPLPAAPTISEGKLASENWSMPSVIRTAESRPVVPPKADRSSVLN